MQFFFDGDRLGSGTTFTATPSYIELVTSSSDPPGTSILYVGAGPLPYSVTIRACWGRDLEPWWPLVTDPERGVDWLRTLSASYPTIGRMVDAGAAEELSETALAREVDPDDMRWKWFACRCVGNVAVPDEVTEGTVRAFLSNPRLVAAYRAVLNDSFAACQELTTRKLDIAELARLAGKEYVRSQIKALQIAGDWAPKLTAIFGGGS